MGHWRKAAADVVEDQMFWALVELSCVSRAPLDHFYAFMRQKEPLTDDVGSFGHYATLACGSSLPPPPGIELTFSEKAPRPPRHPENTSNSTRGHPGVESGSLVTGVGLFEDLLWYG